MYKATPNVFSIIVETANACVTLFHALTIKKKKLAQIVHCTRIQND